MRTRKTRSRDLSRLDRNYSCLKRGKFLAEHFSVHRCPIRWKLRFNSPRRSSTPQGSTAPEDNREWLAAREGWSEVAMKSFSLMEFRVQRKLYTSLSINPRPQDSAIAIKSFAIEFPFKQRCYRDNDVKSFPCTSSVVCLFCLRRMHDGNGKGCGGKVRQFPLWRTYFHRWITLRTNVEWETFSQATTRLKWQLYDCSRTHRVRH